MISRLATAEAPGCEQHLRERPLGRTGLTVSRLGLGLAGLGRPAYMALGRSLDFGPDRSVLAMRRRCHAVLDAAFAEGVTYVDVARSYGMAEQFLEDWWRERHVADGALAVGSKWGYTYTGAWQLDAPVHEVKHLTLHTLRRQIAESRGIFGRKLSLYQIHSATAESGVLENRDVLSELVRIRELGLCIGLTVTGPRQGEVIRHALGVCVDGVRVFQTVQATWNVLEPSAGPALAEASATGLGVIIKEVLANGRLTARYATRELGELLAYANSQNVPFETVCIGAALTQPWADVVLSGAVTCAQLAAHIAALELGTRRSLWPLPAVAEPASTYWQRRNAVAWS